MTSSSANKDVLNKELLRKLNTIMNKISTADESMSMAGLETLSDRLHFALKYLNISQAELAKRIKVKRQVIHYLCCAKAEKSRFTYEIAEALNINSNWLANGQGSMLSMSAMDFAPSRPRFEVPLLNAEQIYEWFNSKDKKLTHNPIDWISTNSDINSSGFAYEVIDKSMYPRFDINTIVLINTERTVKHNEFVIAYIKDIHDIVIRQCEMLNEKDIILKPINTKMYKPFALTKNDRILGVIIEARLQL